MISSSHSRHQTVSIYLFISLQNKVSTGHGNPVRFGQERKLQGSATAAPRYSNSPIGNGLVPNTDLMLSCACKVVHKLVSKDLPGYTLLPGEAIDSLPETLG